MRVVVVWGILLLLVASPAKAGEVVVDRGGDAGTVDVLVTQESRTPGGRPGPSTSRGSAPARPQVYVDATDERIIYTYPDGSRLTLINDPTRDYCHGTVGHITCHAPYQLPEPERGAPAPPPPSVIAEQTVINLPLPEPEPQIDPGYAITGLRAYLETGSSTSHDFGSIDTVLGPLSVSATSTYTVDWGDGTTTGPHGSAGGPYPDGDITHLYRRSATVTVTVTQNWTASWSLAGQSGTVSGLVTSGTIDGFVVREVQAIRQH